MLYEYTLTVPANTAESNPATVDMPLTKGVINYVEINFPIGTRGLVHIQILRGANQVWPDNPDGDIADDGHPRAWQEHYEITTEPTALIARGWSTADTYSYDIRIAIGLTPQSEVSEAGGILRALQKVVSFMGGKT